MPIRIDRRNEDGNSSQVAWLCDNEWEMPAQLNALEQWLVQNRGKLEEGEYVADLGFSPRPGASGGGGVVSRQMMEAMLAMGVELFLSEYPPDEP